MKVFLIPGLGFDNRIFDKLNLHISAFQFLNWIEPKADELIRDYTIRFSDRINFDDEEIILIGHSFGGMIAQEISALKPITKIILISSVKSREEIPFHFRTLEPLHLHKLFSKELTVKTIKLWGASHGYQSKEIQNLVKDMVNSQTNNYLQWALKQLSIWEKPQVNYDTELFQIHGELDKTFPLKFIEEPDVVIDQGSHFMVYNKSKEISKILNAIIL